MTAVGLPIRQRIGVPVAAGTTWPESGRWTALRGGLRHAHGHISGPVLVRPVDQAGATTTLADIAAWQGQHRIRHCDYCYLTSENLVYVKLFTRQSRFLFRLRFFP